MDKLDAIVHIVIESHHIYAQRDLLTCVKGSKLASVFSQDLTDFEMVRSPAAFKLMLEFLRLNGQINCLHLEADDLQILLNELDYWGISSSVDKTIKSR